MYPRDIESVDTIERVDETGLTGPQKRALQNAWRIIKTRATNHSTNIFLLFFGNYPKYLKVFESRNRPHQRENEILHAHPTWVISKFGTIIEDYLWDSEMFNASIQLFVKSHKKRLLKKSDVACMIDTINKYFKEVLKKEMTPTLSVAIDNLCNKFLDKYS